MNVMKTMVAVVRYAPTLKEALNVLVENGYALDNDGRNCLGTYIFDQYIISLLSCI